MPLPPGPPPPGAELAVRAWNLLHLPGASLEVVADILGLDDLELLTEHLLAIQTYQANENG